MDRSLLLLAGLLALAALLAGLGGVPLEAVLLAASGGDAPPAAVVTAPVAEP